MKISSNLKKLPGENERKLESRALAVSAAARRPVEINYNLQIVPVALPLRILAD